MGDNLYGPSSKVSSMRPAGNPNSNRSVFDPPSKRRKTQKTSTPINPGPSGFPKRSSVDRQIDLTKDEVELAPHNLTVAEDSDDSLNLRATEGSRPRIANDGRATQRLKAGRRGGESSEVVDTDTETDPIDEYVEPRRKLVTPKGERGKVRGIVQNIESRGGRESGPAKLSLGPSKPVMSLPPRRHPLKVRLFFIKEGG